MRLNPLKCVFGIDVGNILGFIVSHHGIEVRKNKINAIINMPPPRNIVWLQSLWGKIQEIHRFVSQLVDHTLPFTCLLKKDVFFIWDEEFQRAFESIKIYLANPPILIPAMRDRPFLIYLTTSSYGLTALLDHYDDVGKERVIYYIIHVLVDYETRYSTMEK